MREFRQWAATNNVTHKCINDLIPIIKEKYPFLNKDARTILGTPRSMEMIHLYNGDMIHLGLEKGLLEKFNEGFNTMNGSTDIEIQLQVNIDGIPLFHSSSVEIWPILVRSLSLKNCTPFAVPIFCGTGKPCPLDIFLDSFMQECSALLENGIRFQGRVHKIRIAFFMLLHEPF